MKTFICQALLPALLTAVIHAADVDFVPLLDRDHAPGWRQEGAGGLTIKNNIATAHGKPGSLAWYASRTFADFILKLEFKLDEVNANSGIFLRSPDPTGDGGAPIRQSYEVQIFGGGKKHTPDQRTGAIYGFQAPSALPTRMGVWNEMEISAVGQKYTVKINGDLVNTFTGSRTASGYIGIQTHLGFVQFRNVQIKDLGATMQPSMAAASIEIDPNQPRIEVLKDQASNALEWALAPLDQPVPANIRQNLTDLREDLLDESKRSPESSAAAYALGSQLCDKLLLAIEERHQTRARAGYTAAQAEADVRVTSQALEARRNHQMSWPQFNREQSQRAELERRQQSGADLKKERSALDWSTRTVTLRTYLDDLYRQFREALR